MAAQRSARRGRGRGGVVAAALVLLAWVPLLIGPPAAAAAPVDSDAAAAARLAARGGYHSGIAVLDLRTGRYTGAGEDTGEFSAESVVKVLIAANLLVTGQMHGSTARLAYRMITRSDDDAADVLYGLVGGAGVLPWAERHFRIPFLGNPPENPSWWGGTEITAKGLVYLYAAMAEDPEVGPWLIDAMAHTTRVAADGTDQFFGIPSATAGAAVKQGWGDDGRSAPDAVFNSTGYVDQDRYAVAILTRGPPSTYGASISAMVTAQAIRLMPGGRIAEPAVVPTAVDTSAADPPAAGRPGHSAPATPPQTAGAANAAPRGNDAVAPVPPGTGRSLADLGWVALAFGGGALLALLLVRRHRRHRSD